METKTVYGYDATGKFTRSLVLDDTDRAPVTRNWNIPAGYTTVEPPVAKVNHDRVFANGAWSYVVIPQPEAAPEPTLDELKVQKLNEFKVKRDQLEIEPLEYNGSLLDFDDKSRERMRATRQALEDAGVGDVTWTTAENKQVTLTIADFAAINTAAAQRNGALHDKYNELKKRVNAAKSKKKLDTITWED